MSDVTVSIDVGGVTAVPTTVPAPTPGSPTAAGPPAPVSAPAPAAPVAASTPPAATTRPAPAATATVADPHPIPALHLPRTGAEAALLLAVALIATVAGRALVALARPGAVAPARTTPEVHR